MSVSVMEQYVPWVVCAVAGAVAIIWDIRARRLPNRLVFPLLLGGLIWSGLLGVLAVQGATPPESLLGQAIEGGAGLGAGLLGALIAGTPFILLWLLGGGGAGDAKLMMAIGAWVGPSHAIVTVLAVALAGGVISIVFGLMYGLLGTALGNLLGFGNGLLVAARTRGGVRRAAAMLPKLAPNQAVPYAVAILVGTCAAAVWVL